MNNWKKTTLAALVVTVAGFAYFTNPHRNIPADLRDAVADRDFDTTIPVIEKDWVGIPAPKADKMLDGGGWACLSAADAKLAPKIARYKEILSAGKINVDEFTDLVVAAAQVRNIAVLTCQGRLQDPCVAAADAKRDASIARAKEALADGRITKDGFVDVVEVYVGTREVSVLKCIKGK